MIKTYDYCYVVNDDQLKEVGIYRGQLVMVTGLKPAPIKAGDPYLQRIFAHAILVDKDGTHRLPDNGNDYRIYLLDPRNLEKVQEVQQKELVEALIKQTNGV